VKKAGIAIPNPMTTAESNWTSSTVICGHLVAAICGRMEFRSADHQQIRNSEIVEMKKRQVEESSEQLSSILRSQPEGRRRTIQRGEQTGAWLLSVLPSTVNGTELSAQEFRDALLMQYGITPSDLPATCDGCEASFTLQHALSCKKGGLVIFRYNEI
jgi:hypothetical protein